MDDNRCVMLNILKRTLSIMEANSRFSGTMIISYIPKDVIANAMMAAWL